MVSVNLMVGNCEINVSVLVEICCQASGCGMCIKKLAVKLAEASLSVPIKEGIDVSVLTAVIASDKDVKPAVVIEVGNSE
jgi:hypothetical protein